MKPIQKKILQPKSKNDLIKIIKEEMDIYGYKCDLNHIDTSLITDMSFLFSFVYKFDGDISKWNTSNVTTMNSMFYNSMFDGNISQWDTSNVTSMESMFKLSYFDGDISNWDTSNVTNMSFMFKDSLFNQDISTWDTSSVINMNSMFFDSKFNKDISKWNVEKVIDMVEMFKCSKFNQSIDNWKPYQCDKWSKIFQFKNPKFKIPYWYNFDKLNERAEIINKFHLGKKIKNSLSIIKSSSINKV